MSKRALYAKYRIVTPASGVDRQIQTFTYQSLVRLYAHQLRVEAAGVQRPHPPVKVTDPAVIKRLNDYATAEATRIPRVFNERLQAAIDKLPDGLSPAEARRQLQPFFDGAKQHNSDSLVPTQAATARTMATKDFNKRNGIAATFTIDRTSGLTKPDACQEAVDAGEMNADDLAALPGPPFHPNCLCKVKRARVDPASVPASPWMAQDD